VTRSRILYALLAVAMIALDRVTKLAVAERMPLYDSKAVIGGFFNLVHTRNTGIAFSMLADAQPFVKEYIIPAFSTLALVFIVYLFWRAGQTGTRTLTGLSLILAGAVGNLYDRFVYGYVVDFLDVYVGSYHWPAFNVADSCITVGAGLLLLDSFLSHPQAEQEPESA
jgi:signal peptidase II